MDSEFEIPALRSILMDRLLPGDVYFHVADGCGGTISFRFVSIVSVMDLGPEM